MFMNIAGACAGLNERLLGVAVAVTALAIGVSACGAEPTAGEQQLKVLEGQYNSEQAKVWAEAAKVTDQEQRDRLFRELDPANTMIEEFLKLEEQERGTLVGLSVLHHLVSVAGGGYGFNDDFPVTDGGRRALKILTDHYADHPDLDVFFGWLGRDQADSFLKRAMESPYRHVRGTARYALASIRHGETWVPATFDARLSLLARDPAKNAAEIERFVKLRQRWNNVDPAASRQEALRLLDETIEQYGDVLEAPRTTYGAVLLKIERGDKDSATQQPRRRLSQRAESLRFEVQNLSIGQAAPEIAGPDAFGNDLKLSDHRGKAVVIMFSFKGCGPCEAMYPDNRKLLEDYAGRPLAFVGVMGDTELATVKESVESKTITWPVWWDGGGTHGPITTRWNVSGWPAIFVLDHHGIIRYRALRGDVLSLAVAQLVEAAEQAR
jgi:peroxiredoxin